MRPETISALIRKVRTALWWHNHPGCGFSIVPDLLHRQPRAPSQTFTTHNQSGCATKTRTFTDRRRHAPPWWHNHPGCGFPIVPDLLHRQPRAPSQTFTAHNQSGRATQKTNYRSARILHHVLCSQPGGQVRNVRAEYPNSVSGGRFGDPCRQEWLRHAADLTAVSGSADLSTYAPRSATESDPSREARERFPPVYPG